MESKQPQILGVLGLDYSPAIRSSEQFRKELEKVNLSLEKLGKNASLSAQGVKVQADNMKVLKKQAQETEEVMKRQYHLADQLAHRMGWFVSGAIWYGGIQVFRDIANAAVDVEAGMTKIRKVMNDVTTDYKKMQQELIDLAIQYGVSVKETLEAAQLWAQAGYSAKDVVTLTEESLKAMTVAGLSANDSVKLLVSSLKQFNMTANEANRIVDIANQLENQYAVSAQDVLDAISVTGAVAKNAGISLEELAGYATALGESTARSGKEVGNMLKSIISFSQRPKAIEIFEQLGVKVVDAAGNYRDFTDVFEELSQKWTGLTVQQRQELDKLAEEMGLVVETTSELNDVEKTAVAGAAANLFRRNAFISLMENYQTAVEATTEALNSQGSAERELAIYMESTAKKIQQLKASMTALAVAVGEAGLLSALKSGADELRWWVESFNELPAPIKHVAILTVELTAALAALNLASRTFVGIGLATAIRQVAASMTGAELAAMGLGKAMMVLARNPIVLAITGLTALTIGLRSYNKYQEEAVQRTLDAINAHKQEAEQAAAKANEIERLAKTYEILSGKTNLTAQEQERLHQVTAQIVEVLPGAISGFDEAGNAILKVADVSRLAADEVARLRAEMQVQAEAAAEIARARLPFLQERKAQLEKDLKAYTEALKSPWSKGELLRLEPQGWRQIWEMATYDDKEAKQRLSDLAQDTLKDYQEAAKAVAEAQATLNAGKVAKNYKPTTVRDIASGNTARDLFGPKTTGTTGKAYGGLTEDDLAAAFQEAIVITGPEIRIGGDAH